MIPFPDEAAGFGGLFVLKGQFIASPQKIGSVMLCYVLTMGKST